MPDPVFRRVKELAAKRNITMKTFVLDAVTRALQEQNRGAFVLRDASAGAAPGDDEVKAEEVNRMIDSLRDRESQV